MRAPTKKIAGWCFCRRRSVEADGWAASGGGLFTAEKSPKRAGGCGPRSPVGPCGVHPKKRQLLGRYDPPNRPVPYCLPLPGFARASGIGWPLRLLWFSLRPHLLPRNRGLILHTAAFTYKYCRPDRRGAHCASVPRSGLLWMAHRLRRAVSTAAPKAPLV